MPVPVRADTIECASFETSVHVPLGSLQWNRRNVGPRQMVVRDDAPQQRRTLEHELDVLQFLLPLFVTAQSSPEVRRAKNPRVSASNLITAVAA